MKQKNTKKERIFFIVDLSREIGSSMEYVTAFANAMYADILLYPAITVPFRQGIYELKLLKKKYTLSYGEIEVCNQETGFFSSVNDLAIGQEASYVVMQIPPEESVWNRRRFGTQTWTIVNATNIPVLLLPQEVEYSEMKELVIAADEHNKLRKMKWVKLFAHRFGVKIKIFVQSSTDTMATIKIAAARNHIGDFLVREDIFHEFEVCKYDREFDKNLIEFARKYSQLLILEVDDASIESTLKKNLEKYLYQKHQQFAVLLVRSKSSGRIFWKL